CSGGVCQAVCGDGVIIYGTSEMCDDGNTSDGDGCSSTCQVEDGFECVLEPVPLPDPLTIPVVYRDFRSYEASDAGPFSSDFNNPNDGSSQISFGITLKELDPDDGRPVLDPNGNLYDANNSNTGPPHTADSFARWYRTSETLEADGNLEVVGELMLDSLGDNVYRFASSAFYPLDDPALAPLAWPAEPTYGESTFVPNVGGAARNFGFTTEVHYFFVYQGDEVLSFSGDDDLWVFVDGYLCLDVGGLHPAKSGVMSFDTGTTDPSATQQGIVDACKARLETDKVYEVAIFHAERHTNASNFSLTLDGFVTERSTCDWECGDEVATRFEFCDDGAAENTGAYGHCMPDCSALGPHCGDGNIDDGFEECDDGDNLGSYNGCNPDCTLGPSCGDGVRQPELGEECDAGEQNGEPGSTCNEQCEVEVQ
ncbi:MAG: fibro-slime domain-containing protein, partial [Polyangiales bacterium]